MKDTKLNFFKDWATKELFGDIVPFWIKNGFDKKENGFYAVLNNDNTFDEKKSRSVVMTARHLWTYSSLINTFGDKKYFEYADFAYKALLSKFYDRENGGFFWSTMPDGNPCVAKKQTYGEAFALYAISEYALANGTYRKEKASDVAKQAEELFNLIEKNCHEETFGGYIEACGRDWSRTEDLKLSEKDIDCRKSMNTNLHVMEAFSCYYSFLKIYDASSELKSRVSAALENLVRLTVEKILQKNFHLSLYFNDDWTCLENIVSFGHDIETSWLLWEAALILESDDLKEYVKKYVLNIADVSLEEGFDSKSGALNNEIHHGKFDSTRVWWCQAEAIVGYINAYELSSDEKYLEAAKKIVLWIESYQKDKEYGDWFAEVLENGKPKLSEPKGGNWKTPYHNGRCCMELIKRAN